MKIKPTYTTLKQSKVLKEKGFDEECRMCVEDGDDRPLPFDCGRELHKNSLHPYYSAPEQWVVVEWLRINHDIWVLPEWQCGRKNWIFNIEKLNSYDETIEIQKNYYKELGEEEYNSPQEAYSAAFDYILTNNLMF
jgi:hypothetical protein